MKTKPLFPQLSDAFRIERMTPPTGTISMVLDTDTCNEIDDQFALTYAMLSPDKLDVQAIYAAPFHNKRSSSPADGMEKSYHEIVKILGLLGRPEANFVYRGSTTYLPDAQTPVHSPMVDDLIARARAMKAEPLYVVAIGAITNVVSAILTEPAIIEKIVVVWLGGHAHYWPHTREFNCFQDIHASRLLFDCGVPLIQIPCRPVASHLITNAPEIDYYVKGRGAIGNYLHDIYHHFIQGHARSKVIWDISTIAWLLNPDWVPTTLVSSPMLTGQLTWSRDDRRHLIRVATSVDRDAIFGDLFGKLASTPFGTLREQSSATIKMND
ncbi:nucleoside hydrolase [candidate division KSB1 bacterium]|nr:nucleoside hydrolase [candidate division KSB1 bacterium]